MRIGHDAEREELETIWKKTKFIEVDELGFYHFEIPATPTKIIDFAIEPKFTLIYKSLIREMEKMHLEKKRQSYVETDDFKTPLTSISNAIKPLDRLDKAIENINLSKADKQISS